MRGYCLCLSLLAGLSPSRAQVAPISQPDAGDLTHYVLTTSAANPARPDSVVGGRRVYHWEAGLCIDWFRFQSSLFDANTLGEKDSGSYFFNDWLAVEGSASGTFSLLTISGFKNEHAKFAVYGGGPKIAWKQEKWEPWLHAILGGAHALPQTAGNSRNSYSFQAGGGADYYPWNLRASFRMEADYVLTGFFHQKQNNVQLSTGIVFHF